jgi:hypothetical protein
MLALSLSALLSFSSAQAQEPATQVARVAESQTAEVRPFYDRKTPVMVELPAKTPVEVLHQNVPWSRIKVPGGLVIWVHQDFVELKGKVAIVKTSRLRARPLPSTSGNSHPVGKLQQGDSLDVLDRENDWLKVLAPETLGAWVLTNQLALLSTRPADWDSQWDVAAEARRKEILAEAKPVVGVEEPVVKGVEPQVGTEKPSEGEETAQVSDKDGVGEVSVPVGSVYANPRDSAPESHSKVFGKLVTSEFLKANPSKALKQAQSNLDEHATEVTDAIPFFDPRVVENCEMVFTEILLQKADGETLFSARRGLTRADALRQFYYAATVALARKQNLKEELTSQNASAAANKEKAIVPEGGTGEYAWVGYLKYRPHQYPKTPFMAVRGKREVLLFSFDGRFYLKDFQGREIAVRGTWREAPDDSKLKVLAVEELRVLPRAGKLK